jgi:hypothetical protein
MATRILSLIGPDVDPANITVDAGPAATVLPNLSTSNGPSYLRRVYLASIDGDATEVSFPTGLPAQDFDVLAGKFGSFSSSTTPSGPDTANALSRAAWTEYNPGTGVLTLHAAASPGDDADLLITIDLAHTLTR